MKSRPKSYDNIFIPCQSIYELARQTKEPETLLEKLVYGGVYVGDLRDWLDNGTFDVNERDALGRVPLMSKVHTHDCYIDILLEKGADCTAVDNNGNTLLMYWISSYGIEDRDIEFLIQKGVDINASNNQGFTALDIGICLGINIIPLLNHGAKWTPVPPEYIDKVFLSVIRSNNYNDSNERFLTLKKFLRKLFNDGIPSPKAWGKGLQEVSDKLYDWLFKQYEIYYKKESFEFENSYEYNLKKVLEMIRNNDYLKLENLQKRHINPDFGIHYIENISQFQDENGIEEIPPLMYAIQLNDTRAVQLLLNAGANPTTGVSCMDCDDTGVACAIRNNNMEILQMLIDAHADLDFAIRWNRTPVITAATNNNLEALIMLVNAGAKLVLKDWDERIPRDFISEEKQPDVYRYLVQFKPDNGKR